MLLRKFPDVPPHSICRWVFGVEPREGAHGGAAGAPPKAVNRRLLRHGYTTRRWRRIRHFDDMPEPPDGVAEAIAAAIRFGVAERQQRADARASRARKP
jgi:hypothetical protein